MYVSEQVVQEQTKALTRFCTSCGEGVEVAARFCGACGHPMDAAATTQAAVPAPEVPVAGDGRDRRRWWLAGGIGLAVLVAGAGVAAAVVLTQPHPEDAVLVDSSAQTVEVLEQMAAAETTADLRDTADAAASAADPVTEILPTLDPTDPTAVALASLEDVLESVSALEVIDSDTLGEWMAIGRDLDDALDGLPNDEPVVQGVEPAGRDAIETVDALVADGEQTLADWQAAVAAAEEATTDNAAALEELDTYEDAVLGQLRTYESLRNDTAEFVELAGDRDAYVTFDQGRAALSEGATARREVRSALTAMAVPGGMEAAHGRLVAMVEDAAAAMDAAVSAIDDADYCVSSCYVFRTAAWATFESESSRISGEFAAAETAWQSTLAGLRAPLGDVTAPDKPIV
jgi:hypothetical protein